MDHNDLRGRRLPGSVAAGVRGSRVSGGANVWLSPAEVELCYSALLYEIGCDEGNDLEVTSEQRTLLLRLRSALP